MPDTKVFLFCFKSMVCNDVCYSEMYTLQYHTRLSDGDVNEFDVQVTEQDQDGTS